LIFKARTKKNWYKFEFSDVMRAFCSF
jgi:hypothetical protein